MLIPHIVQSSLPFPLPLPYPPPNHFSHEKTGSVNTIWVFFPAKLAYEGDTKQYGPEHAAMK